MIALPWSVLLTIVGLAFTIGMLTGLWAAEYVREP